MGSTRVAKDPELVALGLRLRAERQRLGFSLETLSTRSGVSFGLISQLERGLGNPAYRSLRRVTEALGLPLSQLMSESERQQDAVVRAGDRHRLPLLESEPEHQQVVRELLTPSAQGSLQVIRSLIPPGFSNEGKAFRHMGTECVVVESGVLTVVHGERRVELLAGDSMTYSCSVPHWWANVTDTECVVIGAVTPFE